MALSTAKSSAQTWIDAFTTYVAGECHLAENTVAAYRRDLRRFYKWLDGRSVPALSIRELADYAAWLHGQDLAPASIARSTKPDTRSRCRWEISGPWSVTPARAPGCVAAARRC